jgi:hypothetical protein
MTKKLKLKSLGRPLTANEKCAILGASPEYPGSVLCRIFDGLFKADAELGTGCSKCPFQPYNTCADVKRVTTLAELAAALDVIRVNFPKVA